MTVNSFKPRGDKLGTPNSELLRRDKFTNHALKVKDLYYPPDRNLKDHPEVQLGKQLQKVI